MGYLSEPRVVCSGAARDAALGAGPPGAAAAHPADECSYDTREASRRRVGLPAATCHAPRMPAASMAGFPWSEAHVRGFRPSGGKRPLLVQPRMRIVLTPANRRPLCERWRQSRSVRAISHSVFSSRTASTDWRDLPLQGIRCSARCIPCRQDTALVGWLLAQRGVMSATRICAPACTIRQCHARLINPLHAPLRCVPVFVAAIRCDAFLEASAVHARTPRYIPFRVVASCFVSRAHCWLQTDHCRLRVTCRLPPPPITTHRRDRVVGAIMRFRR